MAEEKKSKSLGEIVPSFILTKEQKDALNDMADKIEEIDLKPIPGKKLWRDNHWMGGVNGVRNDKELEKLKMPPEIETVQKFINMMREINFLKAEKIEENGIYNKQTFDTVKDMQARINTYLAQKAMGIYVPSSIQEKKLVPNVIAKIIRENKELKGNIYNAKQGVSYETTVGKTTYKIKRGTTIEGKMAGVIDVFGEDGKRLKKISISVDKNGKIAVNGTMLYSILVDGYVGIETLRAATTVLKDMVGQKKEIPKPVPVHVSVKVGYSFKNWLHEEWNSVKSLLEGPNGLYSKELAENSELVNKINKVLWNLSYEQERSLREQTRYIEVNGTKYSATWQGMIIAKRDGVKYKDFLEAWVRYLEQNEATKDLVAKVEKLPTSKLEKFVLIGEAKGATEGASIGIDLTEIGKLFRQAEDNVRASIPEGPMRKAMLDEINARQKETEEIMLNLVHKAERGDKKGMKDRFIELLNNDERVAFNLYTVYVYYGNLPGSQNYLTMPTIDIGISSREELVKTVKKFIEELMEQHGKEAIVKPFNDNLISSFSRFFGKRFDPANTLQMAESFVDQYSKQFNGSQFLKLAEMEKDIRAFSIMLSYSNYMKRNIKLKEQEKNIATITH